MSTRDQVLALAQAGAPPRTIATELGISKVTASHYIWEARRAGMVLPRSKRGMPRAAGHSFVHLDPETVARLRPDAERRGQSVAELVRALVMTVLEARLIDAVLDDREGADA